MSAMHIVRLMLRPGIESLKLGPEDRIGVPFATQLRQWTIEGKLRAVWTHIPNEMGGAGGSRHADEKVRRSAARLAQIRYAIAKALGLIPGFSDYVFLWDGGCAALEAKAKDGTQQPEQVDFQKWCADRNVPYFIFRSPEEGYAILRELGVLD